MGVFSEPSQLNTYHLDPDGRNMLVEAGLTTRQIEIVDGIIGSAEGPLESDCDHVGLRAEVMCQVMRNHAQVASVETIGANHEFDADKIVSDFSKIWRAIEG